jgi:tetratricopeptide (TPR) repeat protein
VELGSALLTAGRFDEAIALADSAEAELRNAPGGAAPWSDLGDNLPWVLNNRANAWRASGRIDAAIAELERASGQREQGVANVSQVLNLGSLLCSAGRPADALAAIARVGEGMSTYGRMVHEAVRLCAAVQSRDAATVDTALAYLASERQTSEAIYQEALVEAGRLDDAARELLARLTSPWLRAEALLEVQHVIEPPPLPGMAAAQRNRMALLARADVREAIDAVGRREHYRIYLAR